MIKLSFVVVGLAVAVLPLFVKPAAAQGATATVEISPFQGNGTLTPISRMEYTNGQGDMTYASLITRKANPRLNQSKSESGVTVTSLTNYTGAPVSLANPAQVTISTWGEVIVSYGTAKSSIRLDGIGFSYDVSGTPDLDANYTNSYTQEYVVTYLAPGATISLNGAFSLSVSAHD